MALSLKLCCILFLCLCSFDLTSSLGVSEEPQRKQTDALLAMKSHISEDPQRVLSNWSTNTSDFCIWAGIFCNMEGNSVVSINLTGMSLKGTISPSIANLTLLKNLDLSANIFHGDVPQELGSLTQLESLVLRKNAFNGSIPSSLGKLTRLGILDLSENNFIGTIPSQLGFLRNLKYLDLNDNQLCGSIPIPLANLSSLEEMVLHSNSLSGIIPWEFGAKLHNLKLLMLFDNNLSGSIPSSLSNCSKLTKLILNENMLGGTIPLELGKLKSLERLKLQSNNLDSGKDTKMGILSALTNCTNLRQLSLGDNLLSGFLPYNIGSLSSKLDLLYLANNSFEGTIPPETGNLTGLTFLSLARNLFQGNIPSLQKLESLERLELQRNKLSGNIPEDFAELKQLGSLDLSFNKLSGQIPSFLGLLPQLRRVYLHHNEFSGRIPSSLGYSTNMEKLDLSYNRLNGSIPREIGRLTNLQFYLNLSSNFLEGELPNEIGGLAMVQAIAIASNNLSGNIPAVIGSCIGLMYLNLSNNGFGGNIPMQIKNLKNIIHLDFSFNNLSGTIPVNSLKVLQQFQVLDLSHNNLEGEIQSSYITGNESAEISLAGNAALCGSSSLSLPPCLKSKRKLSLLYKVIIVVASSLAVLFFIILALILIFRRNKPKIGSSRASYYEAGTTRLSYEELVQATSGFSNANFLGQGSFGSVYKGTLSDGSIVAVKVLEVQNAHAKESFKAECRVLQKVRHRNLVRVVASVSQPNMKALVFEFMPRGNLDEMLYSRNQDYIFDLKTRLSIAIDIAHALEYLHHDCFVQVVHCDIKPANVLLDDDMTAHLTDFGISRLVEVADSNSIASTIAMKGTVGYIAPEYGVDGNISTQGDVYSYGVLLLEMLMKKRPTDEDFAGELDLHNRVAMAFPKRLKEVVDCTLVEEINHHEEDENAKMNCIASLCYIGLLCTSRSPQSRPTMRDVSKMLQNIRGEYYLLKNSSN